MHHEKWIKWPKNVRAKKRRDPLYRETYNKIMWESILSYDAILISLILMAIAGVFCIMGFVSMLVGFIWFKMGRIVLSGVIAIGAALVMICMYFKNVRHPRAESSCRADKKACRAVLNAIRARQGLPAVPDEDGDEEDNRGSDGSVDYVSDI